VTAPFPDLRKNLGIPLLAALLAVSLAGWEPARQEALGNAAPRFKGNRLEEFSRLIRDFSEAGGFFRSDNFTSNETSYLHVADRLRELGGAGGAYIGVGPEQNFTYIALTRPEIAFIVDLRRQAMLQHLLYKAVFHASPNRASFLSNLLSRPLAGELASQANASLENLVEHFASAPAPDRVFRANLQRVRTAIRAEFRVPLSESDLERLEFVYSAFWKEGLAISYNLGPTSWGGGHGRFPTLGELLLQRDLNGSRRSFLASDEDYRFVRSLHLRNRIIPVVGDFAGPKALASIGEYLRRNGITLRVFYTSNVEQFLFRNGVFEAFAANVKKLPFDGNSVIVRAVPSRGQYHPAQVTGHRITTVLQKISVLLREYEAGDSSDYWSLVTTHYIAGQPR